MTETNRQGLIEASQVMKRDWNERARENAKWYITTVSLEQSEEDFDATGRAEVQNWLLAELPLILQGREARQLRVLEIGCGIGRMTRHLAEVFGEVTAVDVSGEMISRARERLAGLNNVRLLETSGVDFRPLPDDYFDLAFSVYVFQHVPDAEVIRSCITDAFRTIRPGGLLKFHTNGITVADYEQVEKDTWTGAAFGEAEIRRLAAELEAQLVSIFGAGTSYCWATFRKRMPEAEVVTSEPRIEFYGRADDLLIREIPVAGSQAVMTLIVSGLSAERSDANNLRVIINDEAVLPRYVGQIRPHCARALSGSLHDLMQLEVPIPATFLPGAAQVQVQTVEGRLSPPVSVALTSPQPDEPKIVTIRNGCDYGTDIHARGEKSSLILYVHGLNETASVENVHLRLGEYIIRPQFVGFVAKHGTWQVEAQLPDGIEPGETELRLCFNEVLSPAVPLSIR
ncbi:MAG TPA: class I SAM-dependent methyltransferase [Blastocatellia bacterium]|nr:class I SAM-dependent methyltransferase [Blastocatellia bacterium]